MAKRKKTKKQSYIIKDPLNFFASVVVFVCLILKELFLFHENGMFGIGLFHVCFIGMALLALIFILAVKDALERAVLFRKSRGQIKNALQFIRLNSVLAFWIGVFGAVLLILISGIIGKVLNIQALGSIILFFIALSLPLLLLNASFIGAFKAWGYSLPLNSCLIVFSVSDLLLSVLCGTIIGKAGGVNSALYHNEHINAAFSDGGAALGFLLATVLTSVWLTFLFKVFRKNVKIDISDEFGRNYESIHDQKLGFLVSLGIPALKSILSVLPYAFFLFFAFRYYPVSDKYSAEYIVPVFGTFSIQVLLWFLIPVIFAGLLAKHAEDTLKYITAREDRYHGAMRLLFLLKQFLCFVLPIICFMGLIAGDLTEMLFQTQISDIWLFSVIMIALAGLSMLLSSFMKGFDLSNKLLISQTAGAASEFVYLFFVVKEDCSFSALILSMIIYFGCVCLLDFIILNKYFVYRKQLVRHILIPVISCAVFVLCAYFILQLKESLGLIVSVLIALVASFLIQSAILVLSDAVKENELNDYPQKRLLKLIGRLVNKY